MPLYTEGFVAFPQHGPTDSAALYHMRQNRRGEKRLAAWGRKSAPQKCFESGEACTCTNPSLTFDPGAICKALRRRAVAKAWRSHSARIQVMPVRPGSHQHHTCNQYEISGVAPPLLLLVVNWLESAPYSIPVNTYCTNRYALFHYTSRVCLR